MNLQAAIKKLNRYGYTIANNVSLYRNDRYMASKNEQHINFTIECENVTSIYITSSDGQSRRVGSITVALQEHGDITRKIPKNETIQQLRKRLLFRWGRKSTLNDDEIISLKIYSDFQVREAMGIVFPTMNAFPRREKLAGRKLRENLRIRSSELWNYIKDVYVRKYPEQAPLRRVQVQAPMNFPEGFKNDKFNLSNCVIRNMPVFAWDAKEAINTMKMLLGEMATVRDFGIVAVGSKDEALASFKNDMMATRSVKQEMIQLEKEIENTQNHLQQAQMALEFSQKKLELASFIEGVSNMTSMLNCVS